MIKRLDDLRMWLAGTGLLATLTGGFGAVAMAAEEAVHEGGAGSNEGMPQLATGTYPSQILWLVAGFVVLALLMQRRALPRVTEILDARRERISADLDRAAKLRQEAEAAERRYRELVQAAQAKAQEERQQLVDAHAAEAAKRHGELDRDLNARIAEAEARIGRARDEALGQVEQVAAEVAQAAVERLAGLKVEASEVEAALSRVKGEAA